MCADERLLDTRRCILFRDTLHLHFTEVTSEESRIDLESDDACLLFPPLPIDRESSVKRRRRANHRNDSGETTRLRQARKQRDYSRSGGGGEFRRRSELTRVRRAWGARASRSRKMTRQYVDQISGSLYRGVISPFPAPRLSERRALKISFSRNKKIPIYKWYRHRRADDILGKPIDSSVRQISFLRRSADRARDALARRHRDGI